MKQKKMRVHVKKYELKISKIFMIKQVRTNPKSTGSNHCALHNVQSFFKYRISSYKTRGYYFFVGSSAVGIIRNY